MKRLFLWGLGLVVLFVVAIQIVPYGHNQANPPVVQEPAWNSPQTRELAVRACFDCHSNQTVWPVYAQVAPFSWLLVHDVQEGRSRLNFSEWNRPQRETRGAAREVQRGSMPPSYYIPLHPSANLSSSEKEALIQGLTVTLGASPQPGQSGEQRRGD